MMYDDYKIIPDELYQKMNEEFSKSKFSNKDLIAEIFSLLNLSLNYCHSMPNEYNSKITKSVESAKAELEIAMETISTIFKLDRPKERAFYNFNLFLLVNKLNEIQKKLYLYLKLEKNNYYNKYIEKILFSLNALINSILQALNESNIKLFKFM